MFRAAPPKARRREYTWSDTAPSLLMRRGFCLIPPVTSPKTALSGMETVFASHNPRSPVTAPLTTGVSQKSARLIASPRPSASGSRRSALFQSGTMVPHGTRPSLGARPRAPGAKPELTNGLNICSVSRRIALSRRGRLFVGGEAWWARPRHDTKQIASKRARPSILA
jgi:hypothetical protein